MASADRLIEVFNEAKARPPGAERDQYLAEACRHELALKEQVIALLQAHEGAGDFLRPAPLLPPASPLTEKPGDRIGRYKLLQQIGEGGCGVVYMAEQEEPVRRRVALKVIKLGMDTKNVIARFEAERQALALMDHPNIARVFDAGATDTGRPFFVMELVRGIKITDYCDQNNLSTHERLELFIQVCQAIQHAHQKGIIHRDIKPSNILVTQNESEAVPKVIDFGIAKATTDQRLTDKTVFTAFEQFIGTPAYMSPEQAMMTSLDIDTRTDIYALGVLLYELLTGQTPFDARELMAAGLDVMRRVIREVEPVKPSTRLTQEFAKVGKWESEKVGEAARAPSDSRSPTFPPAPFQRRARHDSRELQCLISTLRGDLDWIVMKALAKDRTRRYETANGLAADILRHLNNEPVTACPPSRWYEFQKTVRRHKFGFAAAAALILVLALGVLASTWQALRATRAERDQIKLRQEAEAEKSNAQTEAAKSRQVAQFMQDMLKGVGPSAALGRDTTTMLREILDQTARRLNALKGQPAVEADLRTTLGNVYFDLGEYTNAAAMHREALELQKQRLGDEHPEVASALDFLATALWKQGQRAEAEAIYRDALAMRRKLLGEENKAVADSLDSVARIVEAQGNLAEAETLWREALSLRRKLFGNESADVAYVLHPLAWTISGRGNQIEAEALSREELAIWRKSFGNDHPNVSWALADLTVFLREQGKMAEAETAIREALAITRKQATKNPAAAAPALRQLAWNFYHQRKPAEAEGVSREELAMNRKVLGNEHPEVAATLDCLATFLNEQGKSSEAETTLRECLAIREEKLPDTWLTANTRTLLGGSLLAQKRYAEAEPWLLAGYEGMKERKNKVSGGDRYVKDALQRLVQLCEATGQAEKAAEWGKKLAEFDQAEAEKKTPTPKL
jgi:serine/threonine protein kinase